MRSLDAGARSQTVRMPSLHGGAFDDSQVEGCEVCGVRMFGLSSYISIYQDVLRTWLGEVEAHVCIFLTVGSSIYPRKHFSP